MNTMRMLISKRSGQAGYSWGQDPQYSFVPCEYFSHFGKRPRHYQAICGSCYFFCATEEPEEESDDYPKKPLVVEGCCTYYHPILITGVSSCDICPYWYRKPSPLQFEDDVVKEEPFLTFT